MDQNSKVLLTLDNINTIRKFINDRDNVTKSALEQTVDNRIDAVTQSINTAKETLETNYNTQIQLLTEQLNTVSSDNEAARQEIINQIATLESNNVDKQTALDKLADDLRKIESEVSSITTDLNVNGLFTREQIKEIADTALIESTTFTDDMVSAPNVVTQQLVALIGHFGQVKASNIVGSEIEGHTIKSSATITDGESQFNGQSAWTLYNDGSGHLAKGNINWDADGNVNLSDKVSLNWNQVTGGQDAIDAVQATADAATEAAANAQTAADNAYTFAESNILSGDDINQLIAAAEINGTQITKNSISTEQIAANAITANEILAGSITANELNADALLGKVVGSSDLAPGKDYRRWQINSDGSGWVANKKITWTKDGKITCELDDDDLLFCPSGIKLAEGLTVSSASVGTWNGYSNEITNLGNRIPTKVTDLQDHSDFVTSSNLQTEITNLGNRIPTKIADLTDHSDFVTLESLTTQLSGYKPIGNLSSTSLSTIFNNIIKVYGMISGKTPMLYMLDNSANKQVLRGNYYSVLGDTIKINITLNVGDELTNVFIVPFETDKYTYKPLIGDIMKIGDEYVTVANIVKAVFTGGTSIKFEVFNNETSESIIKNITFKVDVKQE